MSTFQLILLSVFGMFILFGVGMFALFGGVFGGGGIGEVEVWGTLPPAIMQTTLETLRAQYDGLDQTRYTQVDPEAYEETLLNAMAAGSSPDIALLTQDQLGAFSDKIIPIPYSIVSQAEFQASYIDEGTLFLTPQGALALPFLIDPLVMYWNRDLFASAGVATPPQYWNDFLSLAPKITSLDGSQNVRRSAVAMGTWENIDNAKGILSTLFLQSGERITGRAENGALIPLFGTDQGGISNQAESALRFYTEFANPAKTTYSWNRSLPKSSEAFTAGQVAVYFGYASEYSGIAARNPNIRYSVAVMPQLQGGVARATYGAVMGLVIPRAARNPNGAAQVAKMLSSATAASVLVQLTGTPSVRRDVVVDTRSSAAAEVFRQSALISRGWIDPSPRATNVVFKNMIESVISGRMEPGSAIGEASQEFARLIPIFN